MLLKELKAIDSSPKEIRKFAWIVGGVLLGLGALSIYRGRSWGVPVASIGFALALFGTILPKPLLPLHKVWMGLAVLMGFVMSHVVLGLLFFVVITPLGLVARLTGKDFLSLKKKKTDSYWITKEARSADKKRMTQQF